MVVVMVVVVVVVVVVVAGLTRRNRVGVPFDTTAKLKAVSSKT